MLGCARAIPPVCPAVRGGAADDEGVRLAGGELLVPRPRLSHRPGGRNYCGLAEARLHHPLQRGLRRGLQGLHHLLGLRPGPDQGEASL